MARPEQNRNAVTVGLTITASLLALLVTAIAAQAQTFNVLHAFNGGGDGANPQSGLTMDRGGRLYGTTNGCCGIGVGSVFKLAPSGSGWIFSPLHNFDISDGGFPASRVTFGPDGSLYGTTYSAGQGSCYLSEGCGVVFKLQPPPHACVSFLCPWTETVLHYFTGGGDGGNPIGDIVFDTAGNLYGATEFGGDPSCASYGCGVVYELSPSGGGWTQTVIHGFAGPGSGDGSEPAGGLMIDAAGSLYGMTGLGGSAGIGSVYQLSPSHGSWNLNILYSFQGSGQGAYPIGILTADQAGNLYGETSGGFFDNGTIFELGQPGSWTHTLLFTFGQDIAPTGGLVLDRSGNLYGTIENGGSSEDGAVFELTPSNGGWNATYLHSFSGSDGITPNGDLIFDSSGNLYGTAQAGGDMNGACYFGCGTVWEITP
jgi:uncharacterized repeat protein (TIGR03803 family)